MMGFQLWRQKSTGQTFYFKSRLWPMGLVILFFIILKMHLALTLLPPYTPATERHLFWHSAYRGLCCHPDAFGKYAIECTDDTTFKMVDRLAPGWRINEEMIDYDFFETTIEGEFKKLLKQDPFFVVLNYLYKIPIILHIYITFFFIHLFSVRALLLLLLLVIIQHSYHKEQAFEYSLLLLGLLLCALLPPIFAYPNRRIVYDSMLWANVGLMVGFLQLIHIFLRRFQGRDKITKDRI
jgi:hypothetical protein